MADIRWTSSGDSAYATAGNWSGGSAPSGTDTIRLTHSNVSIAGSDQSGTALTAAHITSTFTGLIGNAAAYGAAGTPLKLAATNVYIGYPAGANPPGPGSGRLNLDFHTTANMVIDIFDTCRQSADPNMPPLRMLLAHSGAKVYFRAGWGGIAVLPTQTSTLSTLYLGKVGRPDSDCRFHVGSGVTLANSEVNSGDHVIDCAHSGTCTIYGGRVRVEGSGAGTFVVKNGATLIANTTGGITVTVEAGGNYIETESDVARTYAALTLKKGANSSLSSAVTKTSYTQEKGGGNDTAG